MSPLDISLCRPDRPSRRGASRRHELTRISEARLRAQTLSDLGDQLLDHYVSKAKRVGASWSEIGDAIGCPNRPPSNATHRRVREVLRPEPAQHVLAQEAARTHKHDFIGTEHILLGLLGEPRGLAYEVLVAKTESEQHIRDAIEEAMPPAGTKALRGHIAFRPESKEAIEQARRARPTSATTGSGTEHTLLGLIRAEESPARADPAQPRLHVGRAARDGQDARSPNGSPRAAK